MYSLEQIYNGLREPRKMLREVEKLSGRFYNDVFGCAVMAEDWDNLLVLDACRYDLFAAVNTIDGCLESRQSKGSATREFARNNFLGGEFFDTVYVNANPNVSSFAANSFHHLRDVWRTDWDHERGTVMPDVVERHTIEAEREFPEKRLVAHFMQPHHPFLGPTADREFASAIGNTGSLPDRERADHERPDHGTSGDDEGTDHVWRQFEAGAVPMCTIARAYRESLEAVLPHVESLRESLDGKTVVTADHGNLLGERARPCLPWSQRHAHPDFATAEALVKVPWLVCESQTRKRTVAEPPTGGRTEYDEAELDRKLNALGYT